MNGFLLYLLVAGLVTTIPYGLVLRARDAQRRLDGKPVSLEEKIHWWRGYTEQGQFWNRVGVKTTVAEVIKNGTKGRAAPST